MPIEIEHVQQKEVLDKPKFNNLFGLRDYLDKILERYGKNKPFDLKAFAELRWPAKIAQLSLNDKPENFGKVITIEKFNPDFGPFSISIENPMQKDSRVSIKQRYVIELKFGSNDKELSLFKSIDRKGSRFIEIEKLKTDLEYLKSIFSNITEVSYS